MHVYYQNFMENLKMKQHAKFSGRHEIARE